MLELLEAPPHVRDFCNTLIESRLPEENWNGHLKESGFMLSSFHVSQFAEIIPQFAADYTGKDVVERLSSLLENSSVPDSKTRAVISNSSSFIRIETQVRRSFTETIS